MSREEEPGDQIRRYQRKAAASRRVGKNKKCPCGELRPEALVPGTKPAKCAACARRKQGKTTEDSHHPAGRANNPAAIRAPVNDHRAELSPAQYDWPSETLQNPKGSPLLAAAACIRGFVDTIFYLIKELLLWIPDMLEKLDALLALKLGRKWWVGTELETFAPKRRRPNAAP